MNLRIRVHLYIICGLAVLFELSPLSAMAQISPARRAQLTQVWQQEFAAPALLADPFLEHAKAAASTPAAPLADISLYALADQLRSDRPHPAVARIVVPEEGATSYGSGTLIDVREGFGLVITNWHVVRDATGPIEVRFPGGFSSKARSLKVDPDWDLAALVVWKPPIEPVQLATIAPRPGDQLTICGYGQGIYRSVTGRCTQYYAPRTDLPQQMVELDVEARQGDSGGPIFNRQGQLAGVLFGAGRGTTMGSFGGRVDHFLASLAPDIGKPQDLGEPGGDGALVAHLSKPPQPPEEDPQPAEPSQKFICQDGVCYPADAMVEAAAEPEEDVLPTQERFGPGEAQIASMWPSSGGDRGPPALGSQPPLSSADNWHAVPRSNWFAQIKTALAAVGLMSVCMFLLKAVC